ncbi:MAG: enoyl-CoA hydratase/isomerase family protein [Firmicutes bacterium]|nr:enoyl-CoA hydratase/isomerase family protein [Bacillota bacterium]
MSRRLAAEDFRVELEDRGLVRIWTWARPARRNAFQRAAWDLLAQEVEAMADEIAEPGSGPRCLVLHGEGGVFAAGADLTEMLSFNADQAQGFLHSVERLLSGLEALPIPVIAAMDGAALGGGLELALACDLRLASKEASLGVPAARLGAVLTHRLVARLARAIGPSRAAELLLTGRRVSAPEALQMGLVQKLAPPGEVLAAAFDWATGVAANAPMSVRPVKAALAGWGLPAAAGGSPGGVPSGDSARRLPPEEVERFVRGCLSEDFHEGATAFLERRSPVFRGK